MSLTNYVIPHDCMVMFSPYKYATCHVCLTLVRIYDNGLMIGIEVMLFSLLSKYVELETPGIVMMRVMQTTGFSFYKYTGMFHGREANPING